MQKRLVAVVLTMALVFSLLFSSDISALAEENGTTGTVYEIATAQEMKQFATLVNNGNSFSNMTVKLTADIKFDGVTIDNYTPIAGFQGTFDGCGHSVSGILLSGGRDEAGLFASSYGTVKNVTVKDSSFEMGDSSDSVGSVVGYNEGVVYNCHAYNVTLSSTDYVGGIVGQNIGTVQNCTFVSGTVTAIRYAGGIVGCGGYVYNCGNTGSVTATGTSYSDAYCGGIGGALYCVQNCYSVGSVSYTGDYYCYLGGIVGYSSYIVYNSYYLDSSCDVGYSYVERANSSVKALTDAYMRSEEFVSLLNKNRGDNAEWMAWELRSECIYPVPVKAVDISALKISLASGSIVYDGTAKKPAVSISNGSKLLTLGTDYTVEYAGNTNAGTASVYIYGQNMYYGTAVKTFTIAKATPVFQYKKTYSKVYGDAAFPLGATVTGGGALTYKSSNTSVVKVDSSGNVTIKGTGKATITVKAAATANYKSASKTVTITVKPKQMTVKGLSSKKKRKLTIQWKKDAKASGYEIVVATNKKLTKNKVTYTVKSYKNTSKTISKLKSGKTYYVRIRSYKTVNGNKIYGNYSKVWKQKIK